MLLSLSVDDILDVINEGGIQTMNRKSFELALTGLTMNERNRNAVARVLVDGEKISEVAGATGIAHPQLSKQVRRVITNFQRVLKHNDLYVDEVVFDNELRPVIETLQRLSFKNKKIEAPPKGDYHEDG